MEKKTKFIGVIEPLRKNRFIIEPIGVKIDDHLFRNFSLFNEGDNIIFTTSFYETVQFAFDPKEFFNLTGFIVKYLGPINDVVQTMSFDVMGVNFTKKQDYSNDGLSGYKLRCIVDSGTIKIQ